MRKEHLQEILLWCRFTASLDDLKDEGLFRSDTVDELLSDFAFFFFFTTSPVVKHDDDAIYIYIYFQTEKKHLGWPWVALMRRCLLSMHLALSGARRNGCGTQADPGSQWGCPWWKSNSGGSQGTKHPCLFHLSRVHHIQVIKTGNYSMAPLLRQSGNAQTPCLWVCVGEREWVSSCVCVCV